MRVFKLIIIISLLSGIVYSASNNASFFHITPQGIVKGEDVRFEVMLSPDNTVVYDLYLFYRQLGDNDYSSVRMNREGYLYYTALATAEITTGQIEYYIGYEGQLGEIGTLPEVAPQTNPYVLRVSPNNNINQQQSNLEILVLSPEPGEIVRFDELLISASIQGLDADFDYSNSKLYIDGKNATTLAEFREGLLTLSPPKITSGYHNVELVIIDKMNNELGRQEWSFRATGGQDVQPEEGSSYRGSVFLENRYTKISTTGENYFRGGGLFSGSYNSFFYNARLVFSSEESSNRQPVNRYAAQLTYKFSDWNSIGLRGGDFTPYYNPLAFQNKRVRGIGADLALSFFTFDFVYGELYRGIEGTFVVSELDLRNQPIPVDTTILDTIQGLGKYKESIMAFRPGFRFGETAQWNLNLISSREKEGSIKYGGALQEAMVMGTDLSMNFDNRRILFDASFQASINNTNAGLEEISYDSLAKISEDLKDNSAARSYWNFLEGLGMIKMTPGLNPFPSIAMRFETSLRYFGNNFIVRYTNVERNFTSPGNPYLLKDISGLYLADNVRLFENQVFLNLFYRGFQTNKSQNNLKTDNNEIGVTFSYFPTGNIPSLTVSYINIGRSNSVTPNDTLDFENPEFYIEDNKTQTINVATSYNFDVSDLKNTVSLNFSNYGRDDIAQPLSQSNFNVFGAGIVTRFYFPLITKLNYSQSNSAFGSGDSESTTDIQRIFVGFEYRLNGLLGTDEFRPFANLVFQNVKFQTTESKRNNYTLGLSYRNAQLGIFSLRYDSISYGTVVDYTDSVLNARYQYNF